MTHEEISMQTKLLLCDTLKQIMKHKPFSKITISELIRECNLNRKTFYYHFEDIYDLLKWMLEQETFEVLKQFDLLTDYKDAFDFTINYIQDNAYFLNCIYDSIGRDELKRFLYNDFIGLMEKVIHDTEIRTHVSITDDFSTFICHFYTEAIAGMVIDFFKNPNICDKDTIYNYFSIILYHSLPAILLSKNKAILKQ